MMAFTDRHRAAMEWCYGYTRAGFTRLARIAPTMDGADIHDLALSALIRVTRNHDNPDIRLYMRCLKLEFIDHLRSRRNVGGISRSGLKRPERRDLDEIGDWCVEPVHKARAREALADALDTLPYRLRLVVERQYLGGYTRLEIAAEIGVSEATVFNDHREAFAILRGEPIPSRSSRTRHRRPDVA